MSGVIARSIPLFAIAWCACASTTALQPVPLLVTAGDPNHPRYQRGTASPYDGVGSLLLDHGNALFGCTGSLLGDGRTVLTAAHCVTDASGLLAAISGEITLQSLSGGIETIAVSRYAVHPSWTGDLRAGADLAILTLQRPASNAVPRYGIYSREDEVGRVVELVGIGGTGTGATGFTTEDGRRRGGFNRLDATFIDTFSRIAGWTAGSRAFLMDFDDGTAAHDAMSLFGLTERGTGLSEVFPAPGDSGAPALLGGEIAAISSFNTRVFRADGTTTDIDSMRNSSFGEVSGWTRVSGYRGWIVDHIIPVPEPGSIAFCFSALVLLIAAKIRREFLSRAREWLRWGLLRQLPRRS